MKIELLIQEMRRRAGLLEDQKDDKDHQKTLDKTGFWGKAGAGIMPLALSTGRILLPFRSRYVEQPHTWGGTWGGAIDSKEDPATAAKREFQEESNYYGNIKIIPLYVFEDSKSNFKYYNFLGLVPDEFDPQLNWETEDADWFTLDNLPSPIHFGLKGILNDPKSQKIIKHYSLSHEITEEFERINIDILLENMIFGSGWYNVTTGELFAQQGVGHADIIVDNPESFAIDPRTIPDDETWKEKIRDSIDNKDDTYYKMGWVRFLWGQETDETTGIGFSGLSNMLKKAWNQKLVHTLIQRFEPDEVYVDIAGEKYVGEVFNAKNIGGMKFWFERL
jgi:hypothetical protein